MQGTVGSLLFQIFFAMFIWLDLPPCVLCDGNSCMLRAIKDWGPRLLMLYYCKSTFCIIGHEA